jgi:hypothetical protein
MLHTLRFSLQNVIYFIILPFLVPVLFTFYMYGVLEADQWLNRKEWCLGSGRRDSCHKTGKIDRHTECAKI